MDMSKYKTLFTSEALEHLANMSTQAIELEKDPSNEQAMAELFRQAHSIKGMAAAMSINPVKFLSHALEDLMDSIRKGQNEVSKDIIDMLLDGIDNLEMMIKKFADEDLDLETNEATEEIISKIRDISPNSENLAFQEDQARAEQKHEQEAQHKKDDDVGFDGEVFEEPPHFSSDLKKYNVTILIDAESDSPKVRAFLAMKKLRDMGEIISSLPTEEGIKAGQAFDNLKILLATSEPSTRVSETLEALSGLKGYHIEHAGKEVKETAVPEPAKKEPPALHKQPDTQAEIPQTVKVKTRLLDYLINSVGELITLKSSLRESARGMETDYLIDNLDRLDYVIHDLHSHIISVRMMPLENVFQRLPRAVRDTSKSAGKEIDFIMEGGDVELDRAVLEKLTDPLIHILRNAVDHGIEDETSRMEKGKPPKGVVKLVAKREKDMVAISVSDDGKGMDADLIRSRAVKKGIITPEEAESMSDSDVFYLTCSSGFSTKEEVTLISGRGVGMDVARTVAQAVGGALLIDSKAGKGTTVTISLPRTVAIVNVLLVSLKPDIYAIPISKIFRTVEINKNELQKSQMGNVFIFDGKPTQVQNLRDVLGFMGEQSENNITEFPAIVVEVGGEKHAFMVDEFLGQQEAFIKPLGKPLERISGLAGITTLGDGKAVLVLDAVHLIG